MGRTVEDEVIVSQSIDAIKLKSPRGLFRLSVGHEMVGPRPSLTMNSSAIVGISSPRERA